MGFSNKDEHEHAYDYETDMFTGITTFHGLVRIYNSKQWMGRLFWIFIVVAAFAVFCLQGYSLLVLYHGKPTNYQTHIVVPKDGVEFPHITICKFNPVKTSAVQALVNRPEFKNRPWINDTIRYIMMSYMTAESLYDTASECDYNNLKGLDTAFQKFSQTYQMKTNMTFKIQDFFNDTGFTCEDIFKDECFFAGMRITNCCKFAKAILTDVGKCFTFENFGPEEWNNRQYVSGASYGLKLTINVDDTDDYQPLYSKKPKTPTLTLTMTAWENFVMLDVFMKQISYTKHIQQKSFTSTMLLSNIGGNTGMFLGMSVITLGEIFIFFVKCGWAFCCKIRRKSVMPSSASSTELTAAC